jgi:hypothetical protein
VQVRARFARDPKAVLREVVIPFVTDNARAVVTAVDAERKGATSSSGKKDEVPASGDEPSKHTSIIKISAKVDNPDNDKLRYRVSYRFETPGSAWRPAMLPDDIHTDKDYEWETAGLPEGHYRVLVEATDELVNPPALVRRHALESGTVIVDNTPPVFQDLAVNGRRVRGKVLDAVGPIVRIDVSVDPHTKLWIPFRPQDGVFDEPVEEIDIDLGPVLAPGAHLVAVRAFDAAANLVVRTVEVK